MIPHCTGRLFARRDFTQESDVRQLAQSQKWTRYKQSRYMDVRLFQDRAAKKIVAYFPYHGSGRPSRESRSFTFKGVKYKLLWLSDRFV